MRGAAIGALDKRKTMFVTLAGILAIIGAGAGAYYFAMRPVNLRIAVGPANSDDLRSFRR